MTFAKYRIHLGIRFSEAIHTEKVLVRLPDIEVEWVQECSVSHIIRQPVFNY